MPLVYNYFPVARFQGPIVLIQMIGVDFVLMVLGHWRLSFFVNGCSLEASKCFTSYLSLQVQWIDISAIAF